MTTPDGCSVAVYAALPAEVHVARPVRARTEGLELGEEFDLVLAWVTARAGG
jgi:hypothetical protein